MIRLFIAFPLKRSVTDALARMIEEFRPLARSVRWVKPENMHLTARFLGDTDPKMVEPLSEIVIETSRAFGTVTGQVDRLGGFPNLNRPRVIWAGMSQESQRLVEIVDRLEQGLKSLSIEPEKKRFKPHLTLARIKEPSGLSRLTESLSKYDFEPIPINFDSLELIQSTLTPKGPIYKTLATGQLAERFE